MPKAFYLGALYAFLDEENERECALLEVRSRLIIMRDSHLIDPSSELTRTVSRAIILAYDEQLAQMIGAPAAASLQPPLSSHDLGSGPFVGNDVELPELFAEGDDGVALYGCIQLLGQFMEGADLGEPGLC